MSLDSRIFLAYYVEIMQWLIARKISFDVDFFRGSVPDDCSIVAVKITPHWDTESNLHSIYKQQFEDFHYARG